MKLRTTQLVLPADDTKYLDGTGAFTTPTGGGGGMIFKRGTLTTGDITVNNAAYAALAGLADIVIPAHAGDGLMITLSSRWFTPATNASGIADVASIVGAGIVNYMSGAGAAGFGFTAWAAPAITMAIGAPVTYIVQAGDISGGTVTCRLLVRRDTASIHLKANAAEPFQWWVANIGPPQP